MPMTEGGRKVTVDGAAPGGASQVRSSPRPVHPSTPADPPVVRLSSGTASKVWRVAKYVLGLAAAGLAVWAVAGKSDELSGAGGYLEDLRWYWAAAAVVAEGFSFLAFAGLQRRLLRAGEVTIPMAPLTGITLAGNAIQNSLPAGVVVSVAYAYRQFRRWGADEVLSGWVLLAMTAVSLITLAALAAVGLALAASTGSALDLVEVILGVMGTAGVLIVAWTRRQWVLKHATRGVRISQRLVHRPVGDPEEVVQRAIDRIGTITPSPADWAWATVMGMGNWIADLICLSLAFIAVGADVPWRGLLLAYTAAQLAANLPITPGGLGVVEGSLTIALVAFGGAQASTVAAVLLYRLIDFWLLLPVGWASWGILALAGRRRSAGSKAERLEMLTASERDEP